MSNDNFYRAIDLANTFDNNNAILLPLIYDIVEKHGIPGLGAICRYLAQHNRHEALDDIIEQYPAILTEPLQERDFYSNLNLSDNGYFRYKPNFSCEMACHADSRILSRYIKKHNLTFEDNPESRVYPLLAALYAKRNQQQLSLIINNGGNLNFQDSYYKNNLLHYALRTNNPLTMRTLLQCGLDVNSQNILGNTPLHLLFSCDIKLKQAIPFYEEIKKYHPDLSIQNKEGLSVLDKMESYYSILNNYPRHKKISLYFHGEHVFHEKQELVNLVNHNVSENKNISRI